jgi:hypothetical protein
MDIPSIIRAVGKDDLTATLATGLTVTLQDGWQIWFETLGQDTIILGGNIRAEDAAGDQQPAVANPNIVTISLASQNTIDSSLQDDIDALNDLSQQEVRDAMKLAPTGGAPAAGSVDQHLDDIEENTQILRFDGGVTIDVVNGVSGTDFPIGTRDTPVNNGTDAGTIIANFNLPLKVYLRGDLTLASGEGISFVTVEVETAGTTISLLPGSSSTNAIILGLGDTIVTGEWHSTTQITNCIIANANLAGRVEDCTFEPGIYPLGFSTVVRNSTRRSSSIKFEVDFDGVFLDFMTMENWAGNVDIINMNLGGVATITMTGGVVTLNSSCTSGNVNLRGIGELVDNSVGTTVDASGLLSPDSIADQTWEEAVADHMTAGSTGAFLMGVFNQVATRKDIDLTGDDALGWQEVYYDAANLEVGRLTLHESDGTRITGTVEDFINDKKMIGQRRPVP